MVNRFCSSLCRALRYGINLVSFLLFYNLVGRQLKKVGIGSLIMIIGCLITEPIEYKEREDIPPIVVLTNPKNNELVFVDLDSLEERGERVIPFSIGIKEYNTYQYISWRAILYSKDNPIDGYNIGDHYLAPQQEITRNIEVELPIYYLGYPGCYKLVVGITDGGFKTNSGLEVTEGSNLTVVSWLLIPQRARWGDNLDVKNCNFQ